MTQLGFVILNSTLYTGLFLFVLIKFGLKNLGAIMLLFYMLSSWFSVLFFLHPLYTSTFSYVPNGIEIEGVLYLFTINLLLIIPFLRFDTSKIRLIKDINLSLFYNILYICSIIYLIIFIVNIPKMYNVLQSPVVMLTELREDIYVSGSHGERIFIIEFLQRVFGGLKPLYFFLAFLGLLIDKRRKKFYVICLIIYLLSVIQTSILWIARGPLIFELITFITYMALFYDRIPKRITKRIFIYSSVFFGILVLFTIAISYSRFGNNYKESKELVNFSYLRYFGEPQLNFLSLLYDNTKGNLYGYVDFTLFRRMMGLSYAGGIDRSLYLDKLSNIMNCPSYIFYQLAGSMYANWGKIGTLILSFIFSIFMYKIPMYSGKITVYNLFIALFFSILISKGIFYADFGNEIGNLMFIYLFVFYLFSKFKARNTVVVKKQ